MNLKVYEIRLKVFTLTDIPIDKTAEKEAAFIDSALSKCEHFKEYHERNCFKLYTFDGLYPLGQNGIRKKNEVYTMTIRTISKELRYSNKTKKGNGSASSVIHLRLKLRVSALGLLKVLYE